jgi:inorganic pyrophosphatase
MNNKVRVYIEIEKNSNIKYEFDKNSNQLAVDRILPAPFVYPFAYGFIPNTLAKDNDELDILIVSTENIKNDQFYDAYIVGVLEMEDEQGMDEKVICVLEKDLTEIQNIDDLDMHVLENIHWFFSNYKSNTPGKWSKVLGYKDRESAIQLYQNSIVKISQ